MEFLEWLQQGWVIIAAVIAGVTLIWNFTHKTLREILDNLKAPLKTLSDKVDALELKIAKKLDEAGAHDAQVQRALLTMQRNSLLRSCEEFLRKGYATTNEKSTISEQYTSYSELGGDSFVTDMVAKIMSLPLDKPEQKKSNKTKKEIIKGSL